MLANPYQQYRATVAETASPVERVVMLSQGVVRFAERAIAAVERRDVIAAHESFLRAQDIVAELASSLNLEDGGQVALNLLALYDYSLRLLTDANVRKVPEPATEVTGIFRELLSSWKAIASGETVEETAGATHATYAMAAR
ncbi:MAG: flagellar export chaperone FliS [Chloroflexi bacterium]|nr:flagellar export chaperone FliS [Chloroflexota bacterium]